MDDQDVLVDEAALDELPRDVGTAHVDVAVELLPQLRKLVADVARDEAAAEPTESSVRENTIFGSSAQIAAYSRIAGVASVRAAVGQYEVMTSYIRRP